MSFFSELEDRIERAGGTEPAYRDRPRQTVGMPDWLRTTVWIIGVLALDGVVPVDLSIPCAVFERVEGADGAPFYEVRVCGEAPEVRAMDMLPTLQKKLQLDRL